MKYLVHLRACPGAAEISNLESSQKELRRRRAGLGRINENNPTALRTNTPEPPYFRFQRLARCFRTEQWVPQKPNTLSESVHSQTKFLAFMLIRELMARFSRTHVILLFSMITGLYVATPALAQDLERLDQETISDLFGRPLVDPAVTLMELQTFIKRRIAPTLTPSSLEEWKQRKEELRTYFLDEVVFRGVPAEWRGAEVRVEWDGTLRGGPGYRIKKLRYEAVPGLWIPALLYEPENVAGKLPVVLNVNGHDDLGKAASYKQIRSINQVKRGMLVLSPDWIGTGQLLTEGFYHFRGNQLDLSGTSSTAVHYLALSRALDILLQHPNADHTRVAVTGLSGGGWQTILIGAADERVLAINAVAGYSSFLTRTQFPIDLGDAEQLPADMANKLDYTHLTALRAPKPTLLTYNAKDDCCFRADYVLGPVVDAAAPVFRLWKAQDQFQTFVNFEEQGHNFGAKNRERSYRFLEDVFGYRRTKKDTWREIVSDDELKTAEELEVALPDDNADFQKLALQLIETLPAGSPLPVRAQDLQEWRTIARSRLREVVRMPDLPLEPIEVDAEMQISGRIRARLWWLRLGREWQVPAVELSMGRPRKTAMLIGDSGRKDLASQALTLLSSGHRVLAVDPIFLGELRRPELEAQFVLLISSVGERALGIQAGQISAIARWLASRGFKQNTIVAVGPRSSLMSLISAALEPESIASIELHESLGSFKEVIERNLSSAHFPEVFCFGLLREFDIPLITAMIAPRPVRFVAPGPGIAAALADLRHWYQFVGSDIALPQVVP
jgi:dienelactone hydrolase